MRRLIVTAVLAAAAAAGTTPASAEPVCTTTRVGVCYQVLECVGRPCVRVHVIVDPYCNQTYPVPTLPCDPINRLGSIDSDSLPLR